MYRWTVYIYRFFQHNILLAHNWCMRIIHFSNAAIWRFSWFTRDWSWNYSNCGNTLDKNVIVCVLICMFNPCKLALSKITNETIIDEKILILIGLIHMIGTTVSIMCSDGLHLWHLCLAIFVTTNKSCLHANVGQNQHSYKEICHYSQMLLRCMHDKIMVMSNIYDNRILLSIFNKIRVQFKLRWKLQYHDQRKKEINPKWKSFNVNIFRRKGFSTCLWVWNQ